MDTARVKESLLDRGLNQERLPDLPRAAVQSIGEGTLLGGMDSTGELLEAAFQWTPQKQYMTPTDSLTTEEWTCSRKALLTPLHRNGLIMRTAAIVSLFPGNWGCTYVS